MRILIVGGGLVGLGSAYAIQRMLPRATVHLCEKEPTLGAHQSTHNSGVLHAGLYYKPGSSKATLAVRGIRLMTAFAREHGVPVDICGKLVVATNEAQRAPLRRLLERGEANGLQGLRWLEGDDARAIEPHVAAVCAIHVPEEGIVDYARVVDALDASIRGAGGEIITGAPVSAASRQRGRWRVLAEAREIEADFVLNCGGLQSDRVARMFGARPATRIVPFRGDYFILKRPELVRNLIYPVPDPRMPFLGVHFTRMIGGGVECGPNAVLALHRERYRRFAFSGRDAWSALGSTRLWRFAARYPRAVAFELRRSLSTRVFLRSLQELVPAVEARDLSRGPFGIRAQAMRPNGELVEDFDLVEDERVLHVLNAPSPAATASLAIGEVLAQRVAAQLAIPLERRQLTLLAS